MGHRKIKKNILSINVVYVLAAIFSILFLVGSIFFVTTTNKTNHEKVQLYMLNSATQSSALVEAHFESDFHTLDTLIQLYNTEDSQQAAETLSAFRAVTDTNGFIRVGVADTGGTAHWVDGSGTSYKSNVTAEQAYQQALKGDKSISNIMHTKDGQRVYYYFVPIKTDGKVMHVLFASHTADHIDNITHTTVLGEYGFLSIIDNKGQIIVPPSNTTQLNFVRNILHADSTYITSEQQQIMYNNLSSGHPHSMLLDERDEHMWVSSTPLSVNDWSVLYVLPRSHMVFDYELFNKGVITIIAISAGISIFFLLFIRWINHRNLKRLEEHAYTDALTGQRTFQKFLLDTEHMIDAHPGNKYSIWYCDIKNFKFVNDLLGYTVGDNVLKYWAMVLDQDTHEGEVFGRVDADNFVCLRKYEDEKDLKMRFDLYATMLANYNETAEHGYSVEMSAGIYLLDSDNETLTINDMLDRANVAQKSVKNLSGSRVSFYSGEMREKILRETEMESRMETALLDGEFEVHLQPKIAIQRGDLVTGAEALVRWNWPDRGLVPPGEFIPLFEQNGFIVRLDEFVLEQACLLLRDHTIQLPGQPFCISVNVSRIGIMQPTFIERYVYIKNKYQIPDGAIELEFTESIAFENHLLFRTVVRELQRNGFKCSLDDFGSGHSSLNLLKDLPVDILKIDRLFFSQSEDTSRDRELINSVISMANALNMRTVAEGVERADQVDMLREMNCDIVQGYVYSPPLPQQEFFRYATQMNASAPETTE